MASTPSAKARTELNVAIGYVDRAARRLAGEPGYLRHARTLERLSGELGGSGPADHHRPAPAQGGVVMAGAAKLIRDRIPELAGAGGQLVAFREATGAEFGWLLRDKLLEEAAEAATAGPTELLEELGDVLQVLYALASQAGYSPAEIECARARKTRTHGAYTRRLIRQSTPGPAAPVTPKEVPVREHATSVHLMLDPTDPSQLEVEARQHPEPELADTFYLTSDSLRCRISLSGPPELLLALVERLRAELVAALAGADRSDLRAPAVTGPADQETST
jgi:predicted house-cleaning noncanonical NTP pyrophosphatase (MazG superfamily)